MSQKDSSLHYIFNGKDLRIFFPPFRKGPDYFSSMYLNFLFPKNTKGELEKARCRLRGEGIWMKKRISNEHD